MVGYRLVQFPSVVPYTRLSVFVQDLKRRKQGSLEIFNCVEHCIVLFYVNYVRMSEMLSGLLTAPGWTPDITSRSTLHTCKAREEVMTG